MHDEPLEGGRPVQVPLVVHATNAYHLVGIWYMHNILSMMRHYNIWNKKEMTKNFETYKRQLHVYMGINLIETTDMSMFWLPD